MFMAFFSPHTGLYLSLSLFLFLLNYKLLFPIMMSLCRKSVHSLLGLTATSMDATADHHHHNLNPPWKFQSLGLVTATNDIMRRRSPNVLESSSIVTQTSSSPVVLPSNSPSPPPKMKKKGPGGIGFIDDIGGGVNGLMSCTESLGFESSDERRVDDEEELSLANDVRPWTKKAKWRTRTSSGSKEVKKFPPPISSLNRNGQPSFFLRQVRKDGRLELTEVRINRPQILRAYRGDGRLRLHLVKYEDEDEEKDKNSIEEEDQQQQEHDDNYSEEEKVEESFLNEEEEEEAERGINGGEWKIPVSSAGEGFRRCHEVVNHQHHHHLHVWRQHCVTTG